MKIVEPKYEILTEISEGGIKELQQIERVARVCYKSEDKITPDGESAKKLVGFLVKQGHEAMLEHSQLSVLFTCDRAIANELVRHRIASFAQESTRYCNYSKEKFGAEIQVIMPTFIKNADEPTRTAWTESMYSVEKQYMRLLEHGLQMYREPVNLTEFYEPCKHNCGDCEYSCYDSHDEMPGRGEWYCGKGDIPSGIQPPTNWCYVEQSD